ncbi:hypothetical protein PI95_000210 [Hassallia byssoidea VB512170]|uniref:SCO6045-like C-terminal domain-containing protein n=1 Tax=Hassallia byssoidea VB512170 TaxID=1304833 RepID=A0A846GYA7_9CYAN|nr:hypothetical protein [Hassalia byssoidea]NEU71037.1 hypothetical protein [Hassalia byssoidea VB512170]
MGLAQTQQVLAQLYTNTNFRERFFANPEAVGTELKLSDDEAQQLAQSARQINIFANSLKWKRLGEVRELLPRTSKVLGKDFTALFWQYAETYLPQGIKKHLQDAIAFANFLEKTTSDLVKDLVRYEKTWLLTYERDRYFQISWFRYAVHRDCKPQLAIAIWYRFPQGQLHHIVRGVGSRE